MGGTNSENDYLKSLIHQFWDYAEAELTLGEPVLDSEQRNDQRPPVFRKTKAARNILIPSSVDDELRTKIEATLPFKERHRWFHSMKSSQALAQSVFGNLMVNGNLGLLHDLESDQGLPAFCDDLSTAKAQLEYPVKYLGESEPSLTSVDVLIEGSKRIAVECKLTEPEFGTCSRPKLKEGKDDNYVRDHCNGCYTRQRARESRCSLTEVGVRYWDYVPNLLDWKCDEDLVPCPLRITYQLIRNVLAACVSLDGHIDSGNAFALIIYDTRNPSFQDGGTASEQWKAAKAALLAPELLRSVSWQTVVKHLVQSREEPWLVEQLKKKYGF